ncbi:MAG: two-component system, cell cycle response regulator [Actinomycetota bacterium]|nr:two-component system, cell cycle response regulator [Actinomycetota bacterium]
MNATPQAGTVLVVEDEAVNRLLLVRSLELEGLTTASAADGLEALDMLRSRSFDLVLLDIIMPLADGYQVLAAMNADPSLRHVPVIVISGLEDMDSVVRCIEMGAEDYLPKPFDPALLRARINAGLAKKRLRDLQQEYLDQVGLVVDAAVAVEADRFELGNLDSVSRRTDALGQLARVFCRMARTVREREDRLREQVRELSIEIDTGRTARRAAEVTESEYFLNLEQRVHELRIAADEPPTGGGRES